MRRLGVTVLMLVAWLGSCGDRPRAAQRGARTTSAPRTSARAPSGAPAAASSASPRAAAAPLRLFAKRFVVKIRQAPDKAAFRIGYLRAGAVLRARTAEPIGYDRCRKGWYELETGGFVCSTVDAIMFAGTRLPERQARQPDLGAPLPYPYGYSRRRNTPMYRRLPTDQEAVLHESAPVPVPAEPALPAIGLVEPAAIEPSVPSIAPEAAGAPAEAVEAGDPVVPTLASLLGDQGSVLMRRMERGFYVSLDREMQRGARSYWRTQSNGFIPSRGLLLVEPREFHGVNLKEASAALPIGFVLSNKALVYSPDARGRLRRSAPAVQRETFAIASEIESHGEGYYAAADGRHFRARDVTRIDRRDKPSEVADGEKWIDVDLGNQSLVAYVGAEPVFATLISSGRIKDELDPLKNFQTPVGAFRIRSKHLTATMDGDHAIDGPYSIEDVPYVMYFELAFALHAAFWHDSFGRPRSHGCINLAPLDAKWLFGFADPPLPPPWHGVYPTEQLQGTRLYIHGQTPLR